LSGALLDTSVLIASDEAGALSLPEQAAISVITVGELRAGVLLAQGRERDARARRLAAVQAVFRPLLVNEEVADAFGEALAWARAARRSEKATDLLIVATAAATGRILYTLDARQASIAEGLGLEVERARRTSSP
jgi:predicted nucleic acid-binding protein